MIRHLIVSQHLPATATAMTPRLIFALMIGIATPEIAISFAQPPSVEELYQNWQDWCEDVKAFTPRKVVSVKKTHELEHRMGFSQETEELYYESDQHHAYNCVRVPIKGKEQKGDPYFVTIVHPQYYATITRSSEDANWRIYRADPPKDDSPAFGPLSCVLSLPGNMSREDRTMDERYEAQVLESSDDEVTVSFKIREPKKENYQGGWGTVDVFEVVFDRDRQWLPRAFRRHHQIPELEKEFWWYIGFERMRPVDGILIPRRFQTWKGRDDKGKLIKTHEINSIARVSADAVAQQTDLTRYELPQMDLRPESSFNWWYVVAAAIVVAVGLFTWRRKQALG